MICIIPRHSVPYSIEILQQFCRNIAKILRNIAAIFQQYCSNVKMSILKILIRNVAAILQHNIYAILGFAHRRSTYSIIAETL